MHSMMAKLMPKAFTLVELIMVVSIIGMMAIFVIPNYSKSVNKAYERAGSNNLYIVYSAQMTRINNAQPTQAGATTALVNTNLSLSIIPNGMDYSCTAPTASTFNCRADRSDGTFRLQVTNANPANVCCCTSVGACPSIAACSPVC